MTTSIIYNNSIIATLTKQSSTLLTSGKALNYNINIIHDTPQSYNADSIATRAYPSEIIGYSASYIAANVFFSSTLTTASFPNVTSIGSYAFAYCRQLESISFPNCSDVGSFAFMYCSNSMLTSADFPECSFARYFAFRYCTKLTSISFPNLVQTENNTFGHCEALSSVYLPKLEFLGSSTFGACFSLRTVRLPICSLIGAQAFRSCRNLLYLYLDEITSVPTIQGADVFMSTPIGGYTSSTGGVYGSIFVPASLVSDFKAAANWSAFSDRIVGISDSSSSSIPDTLAAKFVKRWYDTGSTASCTEANHYNTLPNLPLVLGNPVTHLTYQIVTDSAFSAQLQGTTSPMGEGPHVYLSSAAPTDIDYMGTCIYSHIDDGMDWTNVATVFSVAAGNNGNYLTIHTWCDDWDNDIYTEAAIQVSSYSGEYYLLKK